MIGEVLPGFTWDGISWTGIIIFTVIAILRGWLIPKRSHDREIQILDDRIEEYKAEVSEWKDVAHAADEVARTVRMQNSELLELSRTSAHALNEIAKKADGYSDQQKPKQ